MSSSAQCFAMRCAVVFVFAWVAFASGATWQEPLMGAAKIPAAELDRLGKEVQLAAHRAVHCFFVRLWLWLRVWRCRSFCPKRIRRAMGISQGALLAQVR